MRYLPFLLVCAALPAAAQQMEAKIRSAIASFPGSVHVFAKNLETGAAFGVRQDDRVRTASTIKLPIMAAVFAAVEQGKARWDEEIVLTDEAKVSGSGVLFELSAGTKLRLRDLIRLMIVLSDNTATNLLLDRFSADYVNGEIAKWGLRETRSLRKILGDGRNLKPVATGHSREGLQEEFRKYGIGVSTAREMVALIEKLAAGGEPAKEMLAILGRQQDKDGIGRALPGDAVASKSGALDRLRSDVALVHSDGGRIAISIAVDDMPKTDWSADNAGKLLISRLTGYLLEGLSVPTSVLSAPEKVITLQTAMDHVQGIEVEDQHLWVTWVDRKQRTGHLGLFELATGKLLRSVELQKGEQFHPGGLSKADGSLWLPVAEYKPGSSSSIQQRHPETLALLSEFPVADHIGCVAAAGGKLYGGNWDARQVYVWDAKGSLLERKDNPTRTSFQDWKLRDRQLVGGGLRSNDGAIDWLDPATLQLKKRLLAGKTDRGVVLTHEGMTVSGGRLYLLPEDGPSRLFVFALPTLE